MGTLVDNRGRTYGALLLFLLLLLGASAQSTAAQTAVSPVIANTATVNYPNDITFRLEVDPDVTIVDAVLTYDVAQTSCLDVSTQVPVAVNAPTADGQVIEWQWVMIRSGNPPPGATLWWEWTVTDDAGNRYTTPRETLTLRDERFAWRRVSDGAVTVHWYDGDEVGPTLLDAAVSGLQLLQEDMGIELQQDVEFYIYGSAEEMRDAVLYIQDWAGGVAFPEYNVILMGVPPGIADSWGRSTVRHELAHLVVGQFGQSCVGGRRPTWLEEGLAMYAEGAPSEQVRSDLARGVRENSFAPVRSLNGAFPAHDAEASSAYSQSYSLVTFLREAYGQEKIQALLLALAQGAGTDAALEQVYGFNVDGLEQAWRTWIGVAQRPIPPTPTPLVAANVPTAVPLAAPVDVPTPPAAAAAPPEAEAPAPAISICGVGLVPLLLLAWLRRR